VSDRCRFAPTTSGAAHPGTLLAALLCWLDARSRGAAVALRLEDIDSARCTPESAEDMRAALTWLGLDWDEEIVQSARSTDHADALDRLAAAGCLYPCGCSRSDVSRAGTPAVDGGFRYPGTCRGRALPPAGWRACEEALRLRLPETRVAPWDEGGLDLSQRPARDMGDPVLRRRDGTVAYHLAAVVDDAAAGVTRVIRGRDLAPSTAIQVLLQQQLGFATPTYRHHFLLLEERGGKLAKLHGAVGWRELRAKIGPRHLCHLLAAVAGIAEGTGDTSPAELVATFDWGRVTTRDVVLRWTGEELLVARDHLDPPPST
jgi:glutamyl-tRNA synthetase/glutamyl-Q tRNA(Asp) synthetase